jgi:dCMP deaminase
MELEFFLKELQRAAAKSKDTRAQVGAVLIDKHGNYLLNACNDFPNGVADTPERRGRPEKYLYTEHAERNAIYAAARKGYALQGGTIVQSWYPCADCARGIVQAGIIRVFCEKPNFQDPRWGATFKAGERILIEGGVVINCYTTVEPKTNARDDRAITDVLI